MKRIISTLTLTFIIITVPVTASALTDKQQQEIEAIKKNNEKVMKQIEEMQKQAEKAQLENQKKMEELQKKSAAKAAANKPVTTKTEKFHSNDYTKYISARDNALIKKIPQNVMNDGELREYLQKVSKKVEGALSAEAKKNAELIIKEVKKKYKTNTALANAANGCAMTGHIEEALYIMGEACLENPSDTDNLNNYAALLTMSKGGNLAIPILNKLNKQYPNNSTILNNLGQAWFSLGDTDEAEKYLDAAILAFPYHAQANYTKSIIEGSKGNKSAEIIALKNSLTRSYNGSKAQRLKKLGEKLDIQSGWGFHVPQDALGLDKFVIPPYPKNTGEVAAAAQQWKIFRAQCKESREKIEAKNKILKKELNEKAAARAKLMEKLIKSMDQDGMRKFMAEEKRDAPPFANKAIAKLAMGDGYDHYNGSKLLMIEMKRAEAEGKIAKLKNAWADEMNPDRSNCISLGNKYLPQINGLYEEFNLELVDVLKKTTNNMAYYYQYTAPGGDLGVQIMENEEKIGFLGGMEGLDVELEGAGNCGSPVTGAGGGVKSGGKLADFYDLHCDNKISMNIGVVKWELACNKATANIDVPGLSGDWKENLDTGAFTGTVEIGYSKGGELNYGPLAAEVKVSAGGFIEFNNNGITDIGVKTGVSAGSSAGPASLGEIGAEARIGLNSGISTKGVLDGLSI